MKSIVRTASAALLLAAISLPVYAGSPEFHISDDAEYRQSQMFQSRTAMSMRNALHLTQPVYLSTPRHISDDAEYRQSQVKSRPPTSSVRPAYLLTPRHISDDDE